MRSTVLAIAAFSIGYYWALAARLTSIDQSTSATKPTPLILEANEGEEREFRMRPGATFTVKIDPRSSGSEHMAVVTEDMAPGDKILIHRHPHADELIFIQSGTGRVTLGDKVQEAHAGAIVFIPRDTWIGMENIGKGRLTHIDVWSEPGFQEYMRAISVPKGVSLTPLSKAELDELRKKYAHYGIYQ